MRWKRYCATIVTVVMRFLNRSFSQHSLPSRWPSLSARQMQVQGFTRCHLLASPLEHQALICSQSVRCIKRHLPSIMVPPHMNDSHTVAESTTSSSRPILDRQSISTTAATMEDNGKAPVQPVNGTNGARHPGEPIVKVQPPRREDLQPSYARVIEPDDADADNHGWYGGMVS